MRGHRARPMKPTNLQLTLWFMALAAPLYADSSGTLAYPAEDLLDTREGTVEFWFTVPWDVQQHLPSEDQYKGLLALCSVPAETGGFNLGWFAGASYKPGAGLYSGIGSSKVELHGAFISKFTPPPMQWHHLAVTWKDAVFTYYLDGEKQSERVCLQNIHIAMGVIGGQPVIFGDKWHARGHMILDDLRFSSVARRPDELGFHGRLAIDPYTTLLEDFEAEFTLDGETRTTPAWTFTGAAGLPSKHCRFTDGRFGRALALYTEQ